MHELRIQEFSSFFGIIIPVSVDQHVVLEVQFYVHIRLVLFFGTVDRSVQIIVIPDIDLDLDGVFPVIQKPEIRFRIGYGRIHAVGQVVHRAGVVITLHDFEIRIQNGCIDRGGYTAYASAELGDELIFFVSVILNIALFFRRIADQLVKGEFFTRQNDRAVDGFGSQALIVDLRPGPSVDDSIP